MRSHQGDPLPWRPWILQGGMRCAPHACRGRERGRGASSGNFGRVVFGNVAVNASWRRGASEWIVHGGGTCDLGRRCRSHPTAGGGGERAWACTLKAPGMGDPGVQFQQHGCPAGGCMAGVGMHPDACESGSGRCFPCVGWRM